MVNERRDLTGQKFNSLMAISMAPDRITKAGRPVVQWNCICDCGTEITIDGYQLTSGRTESCYSCGRKRTAKKITKHEGTGTKLYDNYRSMKERCYNPNAQDYRNYGAKGVYIVDEWLNAKDGFINFKRDAYTKYPNLDELIEQGYTIDRYPDKTGPYAPWNFRWATRQEQANNREDTHMVELDGQLYPRLIALEMLGYPINKKTLHSRMERGLSFQEAIDMPLQKGKKLGHRY